MFRCGLSSDRHAAIRAVEAALPLPSVQGYIVWDDQDYPNAFNPRYRNPAFYMNVWQGGVEEMSPNHLLEIMQRRDCNHFIWLSACVGQKPPVHMSLIYAHELQHLVQNAVSPLLSELANFLSQTYPKLLGRSCQLDIPAECEAELTANSAVRAVFGSEALNTFWEDEVRSGRASQSYLDRLRGFESEGLGDVIGESKAILRDHRRHFLDEFNRLQAEGHQWSPEFAALLQELHAESN